VEVAAQTTDILRLYEELKAGRRRVRLILHDHRLHFVLRLRNIEFSDNRIIGIDSF
jgi:hypothetical protein